MDDLWGEDLPDDIVEECVLLASQVTQTKPAIAVKSNPNFKLPAVRGTAKENKLVRQSGNDEDCGRLNDTLTADDPFSEASNQNVQMLKEENCRLAEELMVRSGETSILRVDLQQFKMKFQKRETETSQQIAELRKQIAISEARHNKELDAQRTEMKFRELELEEKRSKLQRMTETQALPNKEQTKIIKDPVSPQNGSPVSKRFLNRSMFGTPLEKRSRMVHVSECGVQTECGPRFRLCSSDSVRNTRYSVASLIDRLKFDSPPDAGVFDHLRELLVEHQNDVLQFMSAGDLSRLVCHQFERIEKAAYESYVAMLACVITYVLPRLKMSESVVLRNMIFEQTNRLDCIQVFTLCSRLVANFGLDAVCQRYSGCLLISAAVQLRDAYKSMDDRSKVKAGSLLTFALTAALCSPNSGDTKCSCMPHVLKTLLSIVEHQTDGQMDCGEMWPVERVELMVQIFEVCLNVLKSRNEPWITFVRSHIEVNRILTILTLIAEIPDIERLSAGRIRVGRFTAAALQLQ